MKVFDAASETLQPAASKVLRMSCVLARRSPSARKFTDNKSTCPCSPAGNDRFFQEVGVPVESRTTPPPPMDGKQMAEFVAKARAIAPKYHTELLKEA